MAVTPRLRRAGVDDAGYITGLWIRARRAAQAVIPASVHPDHAVADWIASIVIRRQETWVAEIQGRVMGMMSLADGWVDQLYVHPDWTGHGVGSAFIRLAKERCPQRLQLWTFQSNYRAQRFYTRHGFVERERTDGRHNEEQAPDIRYEWMAMV